MEIKSLQQLSKNGQLYDLYNQIIVNNYSYGIYMFPLTDRHTMRIDLVCQDIYNNTDNVDILLAINGIFNHLTIQEGDIIFFVEDIKKFYTFRNNINLPELLI